MKNFRTFNLAVEFYHRCQELKLSAHLKDQLLRAASSTALNLAEGQARATVKDQKKFYNIAMGSLRECQAVLMLDHLQATPEWTIADTLGANLYRLIQSAG